MHPRIHAGHASVLFYWPAASSLNETFRNLLANLERLDLIAIFEPASLSRIRIPRLLSLTTNLLLALVAWSALRSRQGAI